MKVVELMKIDQKVLEMLQQCCIRMSDVQYVGLYEDYLHIVNSGGKISYAVAMLAEKYNISERKVYYIIKALGRDCKVLAV